VEQGAAEVHFSSPTLERRIYFVGAMKGVILTRSPEAVIVETTHAIPAPGHFQTHLLSLAVDRARRHLLPMPKTKTRKNVDENFKVAAVQRLQTGGVPANDLAKELGVSIWSLRRWSREYRKRTAAGAGAAREPAAAPKELPAKPSSEPPVAPPVVDGGLIAAIARIELEISSLDKQRQALKMAVEILRQRSGATPE